MDTRIEIFKDELWQPLRLAESAAIKYNAVINKVGRVATREISHTNTFSLPYIHQNLQALGINVFNPLDLAKAMNAKYIANYYVEGKLLQSGFLVINNTSNGVIKVNFIDEGLSLTARWGSTSFKELLQNDLIEFPADYATAISEMRNYDMTKLAQLTPLPQIGTRGYNLCLFPNNLNTIGDKFQMDTNELRQDNVFNPYQSRPIFNVKSLFDLATTSYGYTPEYDPSVNWDLLETTYIVNKAQGQNGVENNGFETTIHPTTSRNTPFLQVYSPFFNTFHVQTLFTFPSTVGLKPNDIPHWVDPLVYIGTGSVPWMNKYTVFVPDTSSGNVGTMLFKGNFNNTIGGIVNYAFISIWKNATPGGDIVSELFDDTTASAFITQGTDYQIDYTLDKSFFDTVPAGAGELIGVMFHYGRNGMQYLDGDITNMSVEESILPEGVVAFDEYGQFLPDTVDLAYNAPDQSIKNLISGVMHKEGILMSIDNSIKVVKFFNYGEYEQQREDGNYSDWSKYLLKYNGFKHNTDYGSQYAKKNRIGLTSPYKGNFFDIALDNQGLDSKYKDFKENYVSAYQDVSNVVQVENPTTPYFEYTNEGLGLVEYDGALGTLEQERANGTSHGTFTGLAKLANVNYARIPDGVKWWYELVDEAIRVDAKFLLPVDVIKQLDLSRPIYIDELGGFYIPEEIKEYVDGSKPVTVKLIKLLEDFRGLIEYAANATPQITLTTSSVQPTAPTTTHAMLATVSLVDYTPANDSTIVFTKLTGSGGSPTATTITRTVSAISPYVNLQTTITSSDPITASEQGYYSVVVTDSVEGISSNTAEVYFGPTPGSAAISWSLDGDATVTTVDTIDYEYLNHTPTSATLHWRQQNLLTGEWLTEERSMTFPTTPLSGTVTGINWGTTATNSLQYFKIWLETDQALSYGDNNPNEFGWFVAI